MTKILITCGIFEPDAGGPATYAPQIAQERISKGVDVEVLTFSDKAHYDFDLDYGFKVTRVVRGNKISNYVRMFFILLQHIGRYDFVYSLDWLAIGLPLSLASTLRRKKYYLRIGGGYIWERYLLMGLEPMSLRAFYERGVYKKYPVFFHIIRFVFHRAEGIIFNSIKQRELFTEYYDLDRAKTHTIFNPVPDDVRKVDRAEIEDKIVFAGRFITMKNISTLLRGFALADLPGYRLVLIGDGPTHDAMRKLVEDLQIGNRVEFVDKMRKREVYEYARNARYLVIPSWTDIQPMQFYESIAAGIPVLLTEENYLNESDRLSVHINPHSYEDIAEKMKYLADDENYKKFSEEFSLIKVDRGWKEVADKHMDVFNKLKTSSTKFEYRNTK